MLYQAANEEYLAIDKVLASPAAEFLMFMNFYCRKSELDVKRIKNQNKN